MRKRRSALRLGGWQGAQPPRRSDLGGRRSAYAIL